MAEMEWNRAAAQAARAAALAKQREEERAAAQARKIAAERAAAARRAAAQAEAEKAKAAKRAAKLAAMSPRRAWRRMTPEERLLKTAELELEAYGEIRSADAKAVYEARAAKRVAAHEPTPSKSVPPVTTAPRAAAADRPAYLRAADASLPPAERALAKRELADDPVQWQKYRAELRAQNESQANRDLATRKANRDHENSSTAVREPAADMPTGFGGDGLFVVGLDIMPGVYRTAGPASERGYFALLRSTNTNDIVNNGLVKGPATITVGPGVKAVEVRRCQFWYRLGDNLDEVISEASKSRGASLG
ncbi:hypothetical protein [Trebonia sp.]|uniref:hypothetical protein n=1 Tax=Trebonia sp. TaxID=2767075 RepID=UPI002607A24A|nr:hypothetical protein [Trebonia sp.]